MNWYVIAALAFPRHFRIRVPRKQMCSKAYRLKNQWGRALAESLYAGNFLQPNLRIVWGACELVPSCAPDLPGDIAAAIIPRVCRHDNLRRHSKFRR